MKCRERKSKQALRVRRMFEADRISATNLQAAYEKVLPPGRYRFLINELKSKVSTQRMPWTVLQDRQAAAEVVR